MLEELESLKYKEPETREQSYFNDGVEEAIHKLGLRD